MLWVEVKPQTHNGHPPTSPRKNGKHEDKTIHIPPLMAKPLSVVGEMKDRTECFDDYFTCRKEHCRLDHVKGWLDYFTLSFNLFKRHEALVQSPIIRLSQLIRGQRCRLFSIILRSISLKQFYSSES
jgi:hypothetical protein